MIKYNLKDIDEWYKTSSPVHKIMYNGNNVYQRVLNSITPPPPVGGNIITYRAPEKLVEITGGTGSGLHIYAFNTDISSHTFADGVGTIIFEEDVTSVGVSAFEGCEYLTSISLPSSVTSIGQYAFRYCYALPTIDIPSGVTSIGQYAFYSCSSLTGVTIPSGVTIINQNTFGGCRSLPSIDIHNNITSIGTYAFQGCSSLTSCTIGSGVTSIGQGAFNGCSSLTSINIPDNAVSIGNNAFSGCTSITSVTIPNSATTIGQGAFKNNNIRRLNSNANGVWNINFNISGTSAFENSQLLRVLNVADNVTTIGANYSAGNYIFDKCTNLTDVNIGSGLTMLDDNTFYGCSSLTAFTITAPYNNNFSNYALPSINYNGDINVTCDQLAWYKSSWEIPSAYPNANIQAITSCPVVTTINVTYTGSTSLTQSVYDGFLDANDNNIQVNNWHQDSNQVVSIGLSAIPIKIANSTFSLQPVKDIVIPSSITSIGNQAFSNCHYLTAVTFENGSQLSTIGDYGFASCEKLLSIEIPSTITSIGNLAFEICSKLDTIIVNATVPPTLGNAAFDYGSDNFIIYVPSASVYAYKAASGWSKYASRIQAIP